MLAQTLTLPSIPQPMKIRPERLQQELQKTLEPIYLISGDEPLLATESADQIRNRARDQGYLERQVFHSDNLNWDQFLAEGQSMSLFAEKRLLEVQISNSKPGDKGAKALVEYCTNPPEDTLLLVKTGKLDRSQQRSKWVQTLEKQGAHIQVWPVDERSMPGWINQRLKQKNIQADSAAIKLLAERVEGNLLAAQQEIEKLSLLISGDIDVKAMENAVANSARYDAFSLVDKALAGQSTEALRTLNGLREEGTETTMLLWSMTRELRQLLSIQEKVAFGARLEIAIREAGVWEKRQPLLHKAAKRLSLNAIKALLILAREADQQTKGSAAGNPWQTLNELTMGICGHRMKRHNYGR